MHLDNNEKKKYLNRYRDSGRKIINLHEELKALREIKQSAKVQQLSDMPKGSIRQQDLSDVLVGIEKLQKRIDDEIVRQIKIRLEIENQLLCVSDAQEARVLRLRYIELMKWEEICVQMNYSWKGIHKVHGRALKNLNI